MCWWRLDRAPIPAVTRPWSDVVTRTIEIEGYAGVELIGHGGVGVVYRAERLSTGGIVAIKVLRDLSDESVAWHRTRREFAALVALAGHANVVQPYELLDLPQGPALLMEYAPGGSVAQLQARRDDGLTIAESTLIGRQTASALAAAHQQGIVHRDVKPQNLLIDAYGQVKLCDFGIAALSRTDGFRTRTNAWSLRYASPEDLDGEIDVGPASDVYSLGATLLHVVHGAPPSLKDRLVDWEPPASNDPHRTELDAILEACLRPKPDQRPTAGELTDRFERLGWSLDERCRALPVDESELWRSASRSFAELDDGATCAAEVAAGTDPGLIVGRARPLIDTATGIGRDETLLRADRRRSPQPIDRPNPPRSRRLIVTIATMSAAVLAAAGLGWLFWPGDSTGSMAQPSRPIVGIVPPTLAPEAAVATIAIAPSSVVPVVGRGPDVSFVGRPDGLVAVHDASVVWPFGPVGECLVQDAAAELQVVPCGQPHDLQRIAVADLDAAVFPPGATFDGEAVHAAVVTACRAELESFVGSDLEVFDVPLTRPSAASWGQGDRRFQCLLGVAERRLVGDAASVRRPLD